MKRLRVLVDMDDTIENLCETWVSVLNEIHGLNVGVNDISDWDISKAFPTLTKEQVFAPLSCEGFWERVKPFDDAIIYLKQLLVDGLEVIIVTASSPVSIPMKLEKVLFKYFSFFSMNDVIITSRKQLIKGDIMVDDAPHNLIGGDYVKILMSAPHNKNYNASENGMIRVWNWEQAYEIIRDIAERSG